MHVNLLLLNFQSISHKIWAYKMKAAQYQIHVVFTKNETYKLTTFLSLFMT